MKKCFLILCILPICLWAQPIDISKGWKFKQGDNTEWAKPDFNDGDWKPIEVGKFWEFQGYEGYNGHAWYRKKVHMPSSLKQNSVWKDSLRISLGLIDDHDQVFLNGIMIGQNAGMKFEFGNNNNTPDQTAYNKYRNYVLSVNHPAIKWDAENTIAVRVYDQVGDGGIGGNKPFTIAMVDEIDFMAIDAQKQDFVFQPNGNLSKKIEIHNSAPKNVTIEGTLKVTVFNLINRKVLANYSVWMAVSNKKPTEFEYTLPMAENVAVKYEFEAEKSKNTIALLQEIPYLLTPAEKPEPAINGAKIYGQGVGKPFMYRVPVSGSRPMQITAENLPQGLTINPENGLITGMVNKKGEYNVQITAKNSYGTAKSAFKIVIGGGIGLTPAMGWNSWNCWGLEVSDEKVRSSAQALLDKGLIHYGWNYMNIDDGWEAERDAKGILQPNNKFPDMKKLADDLHKEGIKLGIYSSPGPKTCGGYEGSYNYEQIDIDTWAAWGIDYLKYDLCSYNNLPVMRKNLYYPPNDWMPVIKSKKDFEIVKAPYVKMQKCIEKANRDIYYSLCQYGIGEVWKWGHEVNAQSWRTTGDITDTWESMAGIGFKQAPLAPYAKPGRWNDPDMLVVGRVGWGPALRASRLTPNEQYTHISLWSLLASPLLIGCDMAQLDDFTLNLLKNSEVIAINQDVLGKQAVRVINTPDYQIWVKELEGGAKAVGIFNLSNDVKTIAASATELKLANGSTVRDVWRQKNVGKLTDKIETTLAPHAVYLIKVY